MDSKIKMFKDYADRCVEGGFEMEHLQDSIGKVIAHLNASEGVFLIGNPGSGKTFILECMRRLIAPDDPRAFIQKSTIEIVTEFNIDGHESLIQYDRKNLFIDDLGAEEKGYHFKETSEVMQTFIQMRYEQYQKHKAVTHFTSNFSPKHLFDRYGIRVESRLKGLCNFILIGANASSEDYRPRKNFKGFPKVNHPKKKTKDDIDWEKNYKMYCDNAKEISRQKRESQPNTLGSLLKAQIGTDHLKPDNEQTEPN